MDYPTPEGKLLGSYIWTHMVNNFSSYMMLDSVNDDFLKCFNASHNDEITSRTDNMKTYVSIRDGIMEYINAYSLITTTAIGGASGTLSQTTINISEDDNAELLGTLDVKKRLAFPDDVDINSVFSFYSLPNVFGNYGEEEEPIDVYASNIKLFNIIKSWLQLPFIGVTVSGIHKGIMITGVGTINFDGTNDDIISFIDKTIDPMAEVSKYVYDYTEEHGVVPDDASLRFWEIMSSAIVDYLNINSISTKDIGTITINYINDSNVEMTEIATYNGTSVGSCMFGSEIQTFMSIDVISGIKFSFPLNLHLPPICYHTTITDKETGIVKSVNVCVTLSEIISSLSDLIGGIYNSIVGAIREAVNKLIKILNKGLTPLKDIINEINNAIKYFISEMLIVFRKIYDLTVGKVIEVANIIATQLTTLTRRTIWAAFNKVAAIYLVPYYKTQELIYNITQLIKLNDIILKTKEIIEKVNDIVGKVFDNIMAFANSVVRIISDIFNFPFNTIDEFLEEMKDTEYCNVFYIIIDTFYNLIPLPPIPFIPSFDIPDSPPEMKMCNTGQKNSDGYYICVECVGECDDCTEEEKNTCVDCDKNEELYGKCPVYEMNDDGEYITNPDGSRNEVEVPMVKQPYMEVEEDDFDYIAFEAAQTVLIEETIPEPDMDDIEEKITKEIVVNPEIIYKRVILDTGHGGIINGKYVMGTSKRSPIYWEGIGGPVLLEGVWVREIVNGISKKLKDMGIEYKIIPGNETDMPIWKRRNIININGNKDNSILISVHADAWNTQDAKGYSCYSYTTKNKMDKWENTHAPEDCPFDPNSSGAAMSSVFYQEFSKLFPNIKLRTMCNNRPINGIYGKVENYGILRDMNMPAVLTENMFYTNKNECYLMLSKDGRDRIIQYHVNAIDIVARYM